MRSIVLWMTGEVSYLNNDLLSHFLNTLPYPEIITSGLVFKVNEYGIKLSSREKFKGKREGEGHLMDDRAPSVI